VVEVDYGRKSRTDTPSMYRQYLQSRPRKEKELVLA